MTLEQLIAKHEGKEPNVYHDSLGIPTIGIGHNIKASPLPEGFVPPLSDDQIDQLFQIDLTNALAPLKENLPWFSNLDEVRQAVLIDMSFNRRVALIIPIQTHSFFNRKWAIYRRCC